jgi:hypothetical protein
VRLVGEPLSRAREVRCLDDEAREPHA